MAETARRVSPLLRVAVVAQDAAQRDALSALVSELGHVVSDVGDTDVVLTDGDAPETDVPVVVIGTLDAGYAGVLPRDALPAQIDAALRAVAVGLSVRAPAPQAFASFEDEESQLLLTPRELEVLVGLSEGLSNKAVARQLDISQHTVKFHVESIFRKLGVATRAEAVAKGLRRGLVNL